MTNERQDEFDYMLQKLLDQPGFEPWARPCMCLLAMTEGIEDYVESEDEDPRRDIATRVMTALSHKEEAKLLDIAALHAFDYRAIGEESEELWQPFSESFNKFRVRHKGMIRVWRESTPNPPRSKMVDWLKQRVSLNNEC